MVVVYLVVGQCIKVQTTYKGHHFQSTFFLTKPVIYTSAKRSKKTAAYNNRRKHKRILCHTVTRLAFGTLKSTVILVDVFKLAGAFWPILFPARLEPRGVY